MDYAAAIGKVRVIVFFTVSGEPADLKRVSLSLMVPIEMQEERFSLISTKGKRTNYFLEGLLKNMKRY